MCELDRIADMRGYPGMVVSDNGTELTSNANLKWQEDRKVDWRYIAPGKADAERVRRKLQVLDEGRMPERAPLQ